MDSPLWIAEAALSIRDAVVDSSWCFYIDAPLPAGEHWPIAFGAANLDQDLLPVEGPRFMLDKRVTLNEQPHRVIIGDEPSGLRASLSELAIRHAIRLFTNRFGAAPDELPGNLVSDNKRHFYEEYLKLLDEGNEPQACHIPAIRRISFGKSREAHGYTVFSVDCTGDDIIYRKGPPEQLRRVSKNIDVNARRP